MGSYYIAQTKQEIYEKNPDFYTLSSALSSWTYGLT